MAREMYEYQFDPSTPMREVRDTLMLSVIAAEALRGRSEVNLNARFHLDEKRRICEVAADNLVGQDIAKIFTGLLTKEFGEDAFKVERTTVRRNDGS